MRWFMVRWVIEGLVMSPSVVGGWDGIGERKSPELASRFTCDAGVVVIIPDPPREPKKD